MKKWNKLTYPLMTAILLMTMFLITQMYNIYIIETQTAVIKEWELLSIKSMMINVTLLLDKTSMIFSSTILLISFSVMLFTTSYMATDQNIKYFIMTVVTFIASMNALIFFPNLITILLGWDGLGLSSYLLVLYYMNEKAMNAAMLTALTNRIGDALLIMAVAWTMMKGNWNMFLLTLQSPSFIMMSIMLAAMTKSAQLPFSAWLPAAMAAPTPVSALVHSSTLVTAGIYLLIRFFPSFNMLKNFSMLMMITGIMTCLMASMSACMENDLKKMIALSTLSQLGVMMMCLGANQPQLAFFHLITHALFKALLFICAGNIIHSNFNNQDMRMIGNMSQSMPLTTATLNIANMSLCGLPFMAGFYSKDLIIETLMHTNVPLMTMMLMLLSVSLTSAYSMKLAMLTLWSPVKGSAMQNPNDQSKLSLISYVTLTTGAITSGASMNWFFSPQLMDLTLPIYLKLMTITIITFMGMMMWMVMKYHQIPQNHFLTTMWFLTFITTFHINKKSSKLMKTMQYNENTWMEKISGMGMKSLMKKNTQLSQSSTNMSWTMTMTSMMLIMMITIMNL
uniref:NADH-ubiquinone oxidoreductase chain 5 n=1 Tax=Bugula neritina TaxID=10212 RepID=A9UKA5_BUGNE|nr:NADH dehydrogenase subunit 5 [Bugula neritina]AAT79563.1 NADH dehydrogenase subunit 5 [Bugula neritina]